MENYKPAAPPLTKKIFGSTSFQVGALLLIAFGAAFFLYQKRHQNLQARVRYLKGVQVSSTDNLPSNKAVDPNLYEESSSLDKNPAANLPPAAGTPLTQNAAAAAPTDKAGLLKHVADAKKGPMIHVIYAEVMRPLLQRIFEESQATGQFMSFKDYSAGIIPNIAQKLALPRGIKILHREEYKLEVGKNLQWFYGLKDRLDPDVEIGMNTYIELGEADGNNYRGNLEIQRSWRELGPNGTPAGIQQRSFPAIFELGNNSGFFISGVMPIHSNLENDDELTGIDIYKILKSEEFQRGESDFVIFVELGNTPAPAIPAAK